MSPLSRFIHQKSYEKLVVLARQHGFIMVPVFLSLVVFLSLPVGIYFLFQNVFPSFFTNEGSYIILVLLGSVYYLLLGSIYFTHFVNYYLDMLILTNDRLIHIEQNGLFSRSISELDLYKIQDVTSTISGVFPSILNYGEVLVQTAGAADKFVIENVPNPEQLRHQILVLSEEDRKYHSTIATLPLK
jgi:hypothetical protein